MGNDEELDSEAFGKAKVYAFRRLAMKSQPTAELRKKLVEKGFSEPIIEKVLQNCQSLGVLADGEWIRAFIQSQMKKSVGPQAIFQKLLLKGISREAAKEALGTHLNQNSQREGIQAFIQKKLKEGDLQDLKKRQKMILSLQRRGFPLGLILAEFEDKGDLC